MADGVTGGVQVEDDARHWVMWGEIDFSVAHAVKERLGTRKASFAGADETRELTGMEIGGVTPFGLPADLPVWVDAAVMQRARIVLGGGSRSWKVLAPPEILARLPSASVVPGLATAPSTAG